MKETIGSKDSIKNRRRLFFLRKKKEKKIEEENQELRELEEKVKKQQRKTLLMVLPLVIFGTVAKTLIPTKTKEEKKEKKQTSGKKNNRVIAENTEIETKQEKRIEENQKDNSSKKIETIKPIEKKEIPEPVRIKLEEKLDVEINKVKSNKIVEEYENKIKEIRRKLRNIYFESDILDDLKEIENNPSEANLEKLNSLIEKMEDLKEKVKQEEKIEIEDNYLSVLVEEDLEKIKQHEKVFGIEHTDILMSISDKIEELKEAEIKVEEKVDNKKQIKNLEPEVVEHKKEKAQNFASFQNDFVKLQNEQDEILKDVEKSIKKDITPVEKAQVEINAVALSSALVMRRIRRELRVPGVRSGRKIVNLATTFLYYNSLIHIIKPRKVRYKTIDIKLFEKEVETNIQSMNDVLNQINKTTNQINNVIKQFETIYSDYKDNEEYKKLLSNLLEIKKALEEKEYEIKRLKLEQEKRLEKEKNPPKILSKY